MDFYKKFIDEEFMKITRSLMITGNYFKWTHPEPPEGHLYVHWKIYTS